MQAAVRARGFRRLTVSGAGRTSRARSVAHRPSPDPAVRSVGPAPASTGAPDNAGARPGPRTPASTAAAGVPLVVSNGSGDEAPALTVGLLNPKARWRRRTSQCTQPARPSSCHGRPRATAYRVVRPDRGSEARRGGVSEHGSRRHRVSSSRLAAAVGRPCDLASSTARGILLPWFAAPTVQKGIGIEARQT